MLIITSDSVTRSPLYTIYDEAISGVTVLRAFGASSKVLRDMLCCVDTVSYTKQNHFLHLPIRILELDHFLLDVGRYFLYVHSCAAVR
jgi:hypothetical protein